MSLAARTSPFGRAGEPVVLVACRLRCVCNAGADGPVGVFFSASTCAATSPSLLGHVEANGKALPSPVSTRAEGLPVSRSTGRRANGTN